MPKEHQRQLTFWLLPGSNPPCSLFVALTFYRIQYHFLPLLLPQRKFLYVVRVGKARGINGWKSASARLNTLNKYCQFLNHFENLNYEIRLKQTTSQGRS